MICKKRSFSFGLLPLFVLSHFTHDLLKELPTSLLAFIRDDFVLNYTQLELIIAAFSLSYGSGPLIMTV